MIGALLSAADRKPQSFTVGADDQALLRTISAIKEVTAEAKRLGFPEELRMDQQPLKSVFYPELGLAERIKSFQMRCLGSNGDNKGHWWIDVREDGLALHEFLLSPPVNPQATPFIFKLTEDEVVTKCRGFLVLLLKDPNLRLELSAIQYVQEMNYANKAKPYQGAHWNVSFQRISKTGIPVVEDSVSLWIDEQLGLRLFKNDCLSELDIPADERPVVSEETATREAAIFAQRVKNEGPAVRGHFGSYTLVKTPLSAELVICRPTDILTCSDFHGLKRSRKAVLVWKLTYKLTSPNDKLTPGILEIYIDAVTGKFAGGSC
jgi:hypothetical protein